MEMRADLDWPVAAVGNQQRASAPAGIDFDVACFENIFARYHGAPQGIGWWTVTSLLPSGNVASTWISGIISGIPAMTSARLRILAPSDISCATLLPSRAPSMIAALISATASG